MLPHGSKFQDIISCSRGEQQTVFIWEVTLERNFEDQVRTFQVQKQLLRVSWAWKSMDQGTKEWKLYILILEQGNLRVSFAFSSEKSTTMKEPFSRESVADQVLIMWTRPTKRHRALDRQGVLESLGGDHDNCTCLPMPFKSLFSVTNSMSPGHKSAEGWNLCNQLTFFKVPTICASFQKSQFPVAQWAKMLESVHTAMTENSKQKLSYILLTYISNW